MFLIVSFDVDFTSTWTYTNYTYTNYKKQLHINNI